MCQSLFLPGDASCPACSCAERQSCAHPAQAQAGQRALGRPCSTAREGNTAQAAALPSHLPPWMNLTPLRPPGLAHLPHDGVALLPTRLEEDLQHPQHFVPCCVETICQALLHRSGEKGDGYAGRDPPSTDQGLGRGCSELSQTHQDSLPTPPLLT